MERKIGEIFEHNGEWYQCADWAVNPCSKCDFDGEGICCDELPCTSSQRKDKKYVFFKKLEKVGEPYLCNYYFDKEALLMQPYRYYCKDTDTKCPNDIHAYIINRRDKIVAIEIKQKQEDMEEKYSELTDIVHEYMDKDMTYKDFKEAINDWVDDYVANKESDKPTLKPFDLQQAKAGKPVCTRDGRKARIICFDAKCMNECVVVALCDNADKTGETYIMTNSKGKYRGGKFVSPLDLMMLPEKKEGWVNVAKEPLGDDEVVLGYIFNIYEDAVRSGKSNERYVATVRIEWEG